MKLGFLPPLLLLLLLLLIHLLQIFFYFRGLVRMLFWLQPVIMTSSNVSSKYLGQWKARKYLGQRVSSLWRRPDPRAFRSLLGLRSGTCSAPQDLLLKWDLIRHEVGFSTFSSSSSYGLPSWLFLLNSDLDFWALTPFIPPSIKSSINSGLSLHSSWSIHLCKLCNS